MRPAGFLYRRHIVCKLPRTHIRSVSGAFAGVCAHSQLRCTEVAETGSLRGRNLTSRAGMDIRRQWQKAWAGRDFSGCFWALSGRLFTPFCLLRNCSAEVSSRPCNRQTKMLSRCLLWALVPAALPYAGGDGRHRPCPKSRRLNFTLSSQHAGCQPRLRPTRCLTE